jgi:hypothetical protein
LENLDYLDLGGNHIQDLTPLRSLPGIHDPKRDRIDLRDQTPPIDCVAQADNIRFIRPPDCEHCYRRWVQIDCPE